MTVHTIYIARHGFRSNWLPPPHPPNPTGIDSDPALAPHGVDQANELAQYLASLPPPARPQFIVASPFYRCVETAQPIAKALGTKVAVDTGVGEWFKPSREVVPVPAGYTRLREFFPEVVGSEELWRGSGVTPLPAGEEEADIFARCQHFWRVFLPRFEQQHPHVERVLFVSHAATKIALTLSLLGLLSVHDKVTVDGQAQKMRAGACSLDRLTRNGDAWVLAENGRTHFLSGGEEMNWNFDVKFEAGSDEDIKARAAAERQREHPAHAQQPEKESVDFEVRSQ